MEKHHTIAILGHFGGNKALNDGQTVKTRSISNALIRRRIAVNKIDTFYLKRNPLRFAYSFIYSIVQSKKIIVLLSGKGRRFFFPILYLLNKLSVVFIYHYSIGGRLAKEAEDSKRYKKYISSFKYNWVESKMLESKLKSIGVNNVVYVPNFKYLPQKHILQDTISATPPFVFCTFSRVIKEKGISDAILAIANINKRYKSIVARLHIYGPVEANYADEFNNLLKKYSEVIEYKGEVSFHRSIEVLNSYYMLLFPTFWYGEGMPGTIIDALSAGLPIIARRWLYCDEMLEDGATALIYDYDMPQLLLEKIDYAIQNPQIIIQMKKTCIAKSKTYSEKNVMTQILNLLSME